MTENYTTGNPVPNGNTPETQQPQPLHVHVEHTSAQTPQQQTPVAYPAYQVQKEEEKQKATETVQTYGQSMHENKQNVEANDAEAPTVHVSQTASAPTQHKEYDVMIPEITNNRPYEQKTEQPKTYNNVYGTQPTQQIPRTEPFVASGTPVIPMGATVPINTVETQQTASGSETAYQPFQPVQQEQQIPPTHQNTPPVPPKPPVEPKPKSSSSSGKTFLFGFLGAALACVIALLILVGTGVFNHNGSAAGSSTQLGAQNSKPIEVIGEDTELAEAVAAKCLPSVVAIDVYTTTNTQTFDSLLGGMSQGTSPSQTLQQSSLGSGVVLSEDGYIITNNHVVEGGTKFEVTIEGKKYEASIVGTDPSSDIAVLKAENASGLTPVAVGDSDAITIGEWVMTIGSPFGLEQSVATGIVSATSRSQIMNSTNMYGLSSGSPTLYPNMIQTDAAINPGNSGGAMVNAAGELIGINTLITSYSGNYSGVGFAIPSNYALKIAEQLIDGKEPTHALLGVSLQTVTPEAAERYGLGISTGAYVSSVSEGTGAAEAGIQVGDIITAFDGEEVDSASSLTLDVRTKQPGDVVSVTLNRNGQVMEVNVTLGEAPNNEQATTPNQQQTPDQGIVPNENQPNDSQDNGSENAPDAQQLEDMLKDFFDNLHNFGQ